MSNENDKPDLTDELRDKAYAAVSAVSKAVNTAGDSIDDSDPKAKWHQTRIEATRIAMFLFISLFSWIPMPHETFMLVVMIGFMSLICLATHLFRKFLMSYVNMEELYKETLKGNFAAAIYSVGVFGLLAVIIVTLSQMAMPSDVGVNFTPVTESQMTVKE